MMRGNSGIENDLSSELEKSSESATETSVESQTQDPLRSKFPEVTLFAIVTPRFEFCLVAIRQQQFISLSSA